MPDKQHANDEYAPPVSPTAAAPVPPEVFPAEAEADVEADKTPAEPAKK